VDPIGGTTGIGILRYVFEDCALDTDRRELRRGTVVVAVEPQVFDLLVHLIRHRDRVVSNDDLLASIWHGRIVSESALFNRINAARCAIGDTGEQQRLIKTLPRKGLRFVGDVRDGEASAGAATHPGATISRPRAVGAPANEEDPIAIPHDKPSIAVIPFNNMSGDPEQEYFADGIVEEIITALSRFRQLFVIARNSSFTYKGQPLDVKQVGRELGVRYVLEGSVRKAANRVRISGQLIDALTGAHLWADRFDGGLEDIFDLQDRVTASIVGAIAPKLELAEIERARRKPTDSLDAYDHYMRGMANLHQWSKEGLNEGLKLFYKAIELDPRFASAYAMAAWCYIRRLAEGEMIDRAKESAEAERLARQATRCGKDDALALCAAGYALVRMVRDHDTGASLIDRALALNPNLSTAWFFSAWVRLYIGEPDLAIDHAAHAMRLSPLDHQFFAMQTAVASAHFFAGRYEEACLWATKSLRETPNFLPALRITAASNALAGRLAEAQNAMACVRQIDPRLRVSNLKDWFAFRRPEDLARIQGGLRKAGLPE
jgi:TolB-like protein